MQPSTTVALAGKDAESMLRVADALDDLDDVQAVHANFDISDAEMARLAE
jgi:transcriptional/translational regulatory protein YebC/TACO1